MSGSAQTPQRRAPFRAYRELRAQTSKERDPRPAVVDDQTHRRTDVQADDEGEEERFGLGLGVDQVVPAEQRRQQDPWPRLEMGNSSVRPGGGP